MARDENERDVLAQQQDPTGDEEMIRGRGDAEGMADDNDDDELEDTEDLDDEEEEEREGSF